MVAFFSRELELLSEVTNSFNMHIKLDGNLFQKNLRISNAINVY